MASELIEVELYDKTFKVVHNPKARGRQPRYLVNGSVKPKGVTTIIGQTLSKDLMQWAVDCMKEYLTGKLPLITGADLSDGALEYTRRRDSGAATGTEAHALVERYLKGGTVTLENASNEASNAFTAFVGWYEETQPKILAVESVIYSPTNNYAGTYDALMEIDGKVYLTDLKTTNASRKAPNGVYAENFVQLGAYAEAHEEQRLFEEATENGSQLPPIDGLAVISAKKDGKMDFVTNEDVNLTVQECRDMFIRVRTLHTFMTDTTKLLGGK